MRTLLVVRTLIASTLVVIGWSAPEAMAAGRDRPNVVVILGDDLGWGELGAQGNKEIPTPHIDSIAADGIRFTQGYVSGPYCSPTRAGLLTGRYQTRFGHEFNPGGPNSEDGLDLEQTTIADRLKAQGYATGAIGKWHLGAPPKYRPTKRGFDDFYGTLANTSYFHPQLVDTRKSEDPARVQDPAFYTTDAYGARAAEWIAEHKDEPFFLYLPFNAQHSPLQAPQKYLDRFPKIADENRKKFAAVLSAFDDAVGQVLAAIDQHQLAEDTIVVFLTDNGGPTQQTTSSNLPLRGFKATTLEGGVRVPFYMRWNGRLPAGKVYDHPVIQLDILPTALAAAGAPIDEAGAVDGVNLLPYLEGKADGMPHESLFWRFGKQWAVRHGDWKLVASRIDDFKPQLFNLAEDIGEAHDLAAEHPDKVADLRKEWEKWDEGNVPAKWGQPNPNRRRGRQNRRPRAAARAAAASAEAAEAAGDK
jgi:arylsulfatase A-like enzyme